MAIFRNGQTRCETGVAATIAGGGVSLLSAVSDLANAKRRIFLVEHPPCSGRRVAQHRLSFSQHNGTLRRSASNHEYGCTRLSLSSVDLYYYRHTNIEILANTHVIGINGRLGAFTVSRCHGQQKELKQCCTS